MSKVFISLGMSLDGVMAPEVRDDDPKGERWMADWAKIMSWVFGQRFFRQNLKLGAGGETGRDNDILRETFERTGASIMGKRMFDAGTSNGWPEEAPFHTPVFVLTHEVRAPWERPGGTTFHFVDEGLESVLRQAREAAGGRDVRVAGGVDVARQYLAAGLVDELAIAVSPALVGRGLRLFDGLEPGALALRPTGAEVGEGVTHLRYDVR